MRDLRDMLDFIVLPGSSLKDLLIALLRRNPKRNSVRMFSVVFARPESKLAKEQILPLLPYLNERSGENIDFYFPGYERISDSAPSEDVVVEIANDRWAFSHSTFNSFRKDIESECKWEYSGAVDLLLMNTQKARETADIDFRSVVYCQLDEMIQCGAIESLEKLFEEIIRYTEKFDGTDPTWGFSDLMGAKTGMSAIKRLILSLLPIGLSKEVQQAAHYAIRDLRKAT